MPNMLALHEIENNKGIVRSDATSAASIRGKQYLLVIAIDDYSNVEGFGNLNNPVKDADDLVKVLTGVYDFELSEATEAQLLTDEKYEGQNIYEYQGERLRCFYNQNAINDKITNCLEEWAGKLGAHDNLLIFFSGHGVYLNNSLNLVTSDYNGQGSTRLYTSNLSSIFAKYEISENGQTKLRCQHFLLLLDCCYAGSPAFGDAEKERTTKDFSRNILAATHPTQVAKDGKAGTNSPFMAKLLAILQNEYELNAEGKYCITADQIENKLKQKRSPSNQTPYYGTLPGTDRGIGHFPFYVRHDAPPPQAPLNESLYQLNFSNLESTIYNAFDIYKNRFNVIALQNGKPETHRFLRKRIFKEMKSQSNLGDLNDPNFISDDFYAWEPIDLSATTYNNADFWQILKQVKNLNGSDEQQIKTEVLQQIALELNDRNLIILFYLKIGSDASVQKFGEQFCMLAKSLYDTYSQQNLNKLFLIFSDLRGSTPIQDMEWFESKLNKNMNIICPMALPTIKQKDINLWVNKSKLSNLLTPDRCTKLSLGNKELDFIDFLHEILPSIGFSESLKASFINQVISDRL